MLSKGLFTQMFPSITPNSIDRNQESQFAVLASQHLADHDLKGKTLEPLPEVELTLPPLVSRNGTASCIEDHFRVIATEQAEPHLSAAQRLASITLPQMPTNWRFNEGWTRYTWTTDAADNKILVYESVCHPVAGESLVFDVEVMFHMSKYPVIAVAASENAWYSWCSPCLFGNVDEAASHLIPMPTDTARLIVGHYVAYDRARVREEYALQPSNNMFLDTLSLHAAVSGMSTQQLMDFRRSDMDNYTEQDSLSKRKNAWMTETTTNSLKDVAKFHCDIQMDKETRNAFAADDLSTLKDPHSYQTLMSYCATDVWATHRVFQVVLPKFLSKCPHPASFAGMLHMGKPYLTISKDWKPFEERCEKLCNSHQQRIESELTSLADAALLKINDGSYENDEWLKHLDWSVKKVRMTKPKLSKKGEILVPAREYKSSGNPLLRNKPKWYRDLWDTDKQQIRIGTTKRIAPFLLRLRWNGFPLTHCQAYGWMYKRPKSPAEQDTVEVSPEPLVFSTDPTHKNYDHIISFDNENDYFQIPHPQGEGVNCGNPLAKAFISAFEDGILTSEFASAKKILELHAQCTYWISIRARVASQFLVWPDSHNIEPANTVDGFGVILPMALPMGTITRRAVEPTWMTASNAKQSRIGSEIKSKIVPPKGYMFVGADVDSEELWIASLIGDAQFGIQGGTAMGFMTLQGTKALGTDLHSLTGKILGISRNQAKVFNYGRLYGAGIAHSVQLLLKGNKTINRAEATLRAKNLFTRTKGERYRSAYGRNSTVPLIWYGGTESVVFNSLEQIATSDDPRTPFLGCQITDALLTKVIKGQYMTSRVNWVVQSSGVDYLHLLLVSMNYLMRRMNLDGRFVISIHDEIRFLIREDQTDLACLALQISNLWVRCFFSSRLGMRDLPLNVAFFSLVDVDHCLRKEVDMDCVTPSNQVPIAPGQSFSIEETIKRVFKSGSECDVYGPELGEIQKIVELMGAEKESGLESNIVAKNLDGLKAQLCKTAKEVQQIDSSIMKKKFLHI